MTMVPNLKSTFRLGVSKVDITPDFPVPLAGFAVRSELGPYESISNRLFARIFAFVTSDESNRVSGDSAEEKAVLISADLLWWGSDRVPSIKRRICGRFGLAEDAILLHGTHTHSGPQTSGLFTSYLGVMDLSYIEAMENRVIEAVGVAFQHIDPVRIEQGIGYSPLGINRRGVLKSTPETGPVDHELRIVRFVKEDGATKGLLVHYACHPVITRENAVSSEYVGIALKFIERDLDEGAIAAFLQGTCGDINPSDGEQVIRGDNEVVMQIGKAFADCVIRMLEKPMRTLLTHRLQWSKTVIELPLSSLPEREQLESSALAPGVLGEWSSIMLERLDSLSSSIPLEITVVTLADGLSLIGLNAEVVVDYGLFIKRITQGSALPIAYTNGMIGYIPTAQQLSEGGYETHESTLYFAMASSFDHAVESTVKQALLKLLT